MEEIYECELGQSACLTNGAKEMLIELSKNHFLYVASNGLNSVQESRLRLAGIEQYFTDVFTSQRAGDCKPNLAFFDYCFKRISNFNRNETIIVGDSLTSDIKGGKNAGIRTIWFNPVKIPNKTDNEPDFEFSSIEEIKNFILSENAITR